MQLNDSAREAFVATTSSKTRFPSLFNLFGPSCSTKRGRQCLKQWLERPCVDSDVLKERRDTVEAIVWAVADENASLWKLSRLFQHIQSYERDLAVFLSPTQGNPMDAKLTLLDFSGLQQWLNEFQVRIDNCLVDAECAVQLSNLLSARLRPIQQLCSRDLQPFCTLIENMFTGMESDVDFASDVMEVGNDSEMRSTTSHLIELRAEIRQCEEEVAVAVKQAASLISIADDRIKVIYADDEQRSVVRMGIVLRVSRQNSHRVQQQSGEGLSVIRASRASGVWFTTPTIDSLGAKWKSLKRGYEDAEASLVEFLTLEFQSRFQGFLDDLALRNAEVDVLVSFALVSHKHKFARASTTGNGASLRLHGIFDPFKQSGETNQSSSEVAVELSDGKTFLLLGGGPTGPGQVNLLQLLGIVIVLNQVGCFVPCREAVLPVFDAIYSRTGAYDQQLYGYSTFMTEMRQMSHIFSSMTANSLVLIEDLCRGTSTSEGLALALSMCCHLIESKTLTCFSSEWSELTRELSKQHATTTPMWAYQGSNGARRQDADFQNTSRSLDDFEKLMTDCDLPPDLIHLVCEEMQDM